MTLRSLSTVDLLALAAEIRAFLVDNVHRTGGHLGPNLGAVELTIALHRVFTSPDDPFLFDTGHQAYVHKLLTGRAPQFGSLRQAGGLSGYPSRTESPHDVIENSHASTALSYADGLAKAFALNGEHDRRVVAVVGDGALTGGMSWEALNNLGTTQHPVIIVLNDNGRSYAPTTGGLANHLTHLRKGKTNQNVFTALGFPYLGPVDGHDVIALEQTFQNAAALGRPVVVHCTTEKGKGYPPAEEDEADRMHAIGPSASATRAFVTLPPTLLLAQPTAHPPAPLHPTQPTTLPPTHSVSPLPQPTPPHPVQPTPIATAPTTAAPTRPTAAPPHTPSPPPPHEPTPPLAVTKLAHPLIQLTTEPLSGSVAHPLSHPTTQPPTGSVAHPLSHPTTEPPTGSVAHPLSHPTTEPPTGSVAHPLTHPTTQVTAAVPVQRPSGSGGRSWTSVFAGCIADIGAVRSDVVCLTAAMALPAGLGPFAERFPERVFDVGIAEQHAVASAAGMAMGGLHPVVAIYATFLSRAFDQVLMDVALHRLGVTFVLDRAGVTGPDGASHHGMWDASVLPVVPGLRLAAPRDPARLVELLRSAVDVADAPTVLRYPKATAGPDVPAVRRASGYDVLREAPGAPVLLVAVGPLASACLAAAEELLRHNVSAMVVDPLWITPLHADLVRLAARFRLMLTVEDTTATGAMGSRLAQALAGEPTCAATFALPAAFLPHASRAEILRAHGLDASGIAAIVLKRLGNGKEQTLLDDTTKWDGA